MKPAEEYKKKAQEAERLAKRSKTDVERTAYWRIAQGWRDLEAAALDVERRWEGSA